MVYSHNAGLPDSLQEIFNLVSRSVDPDTLPEFFIRYWVFYSTDEFMDLMRTQYSGEYYSLLRNFLTQYDVDIPELETLPDSWVSEILLATIPYQVSRLKNTN